MHENKIPEIPLRASQWVSKAQYTSNSDIYVENFQQKIVYRWTFDFIYILSLMWSAFGVGYVLCKLKFVQYILHIQ